MCPQAKDAKVAGHSQGLEEAESPPLERPDVRAALGRLDLRRWVCRMGDGESLWVGAPRLCGCGCPTPHGSRVLVAEQPQVRTRTVLP